MVPLVYLGAQWNCFIKKSVVKIFCQTPFNMNVRPFVRFLKKL
jgi:hypothetical protein